MNEKKFDDSGSSSSYNQLLSSVSIAEANYKTAVAALEEFRGAVATQNNVIKDANDEIPKLEADKKTYATAKKFKEASAVAKEIKSLTTRM